MAEALRTFSLLPLLTTLHLVLFFTFSSAAATVNSPLQPAAALSAFQVDPGLKLELLAAEPLVVDPVAMCFDEKGRLFVAENRDYPTGPEPGQERAGTIALLEDTDGDGRFDKRTEFVSHLSFPNGVLPWDGGLIVTCAPEVLYFKDTDGDGRADVKRVLFTGFNTEGSTQLRVSHPTLGPDGWVYLTSGFSRGNKVICPEHPERPGLEFRTDCRFDPRTLEIIPEESRAQFGLTFDDFGHRFICYNRVHIQHVVFPGPYLKRNPNLAFSKTVQDVPENRVRDWLVNDEGFAARVYPISETITTYESHSGTFTAACGVHVYAGDGLPHEYYGNVFACEPTGNLVHREELVPRGATFGSHMVAEGREFLASPDTWFRPVFLTEGPDGALYICDMYRKTIEHPDYLPPETRKHTDFSSGKGMGRIWRVTRADSATNRHQNDFSHAENELLVKNLASSNGWHRVTAQRLLLERNARSAAPALKQLLTDTKAIPAGRFLALWLLNRFDALDPQNLLSAFHDPVPGLREAAIRLSEHRTTESSKLFDAMLKTSGDPDPRVRFQSALSFGEAALSSNGLTALEVIAMRDSADEWTRAAIFSSLHSRIGVFAADLLEKVNQADPEFLAQLGSLIAIEEPTTVSPMIANYQKITYPDHVAFVDGLISGTGFTRIKSEISEEKWNEIYRTAETAALDPAVAPRIRRAAVDILANNVSEEGPKLLTLLAPSDPLELQQAVVRSLARHPESSAAAALLQKDRWRDMSAMTRSTVITAFMSEPPATELLLNAVRSGDVSANAFTARQREQLRNHSNAGIQKIARELFAASGGDRMKVYDDLKSVLSLKADSKNGQQVFISHCATCHRLERQGVVVGPELVAMRTQPKEVILLHVIVPNYEVAPAFTAYELETKDGRTLSGLIASETPTSVTLRQAQGIEEAVPRSEIKKLAASSLSLMPDELEKTMTRQDLADLLAFLKGEQ